MYDLILWKNRRTEKANTYAVTQNPDNTITLTPVPGGLSNRVRGLINRT